MFLEVRTEPTEITIQRKTKRGLWENIANIVTSHHMAFDEIKELIYVYWINDAPVDALTFKKPSPYDDHVRAVIIGRKSGRIIQVLSSDGLNFYESLKGHSRSSYWSVYDKKSGDKKIYTNIDGSIFNTFEDFHQFVIEHQGVKKARMRNCDEVDDWLKTWDVIFNDNTEISLSFLEAS